MNPQIPSRIHGFLFDLDGTLFLGDEPYAGALDTVARLRAAGLRLGFLSNTTRMSRASAVERLVRMSFDVKPEEVMTPNLAAAELLQKEGRKKVMLLLTEDTKKDFEGFTEEMETPEVVVVGDLGDGFLPSVLDRAFLALLRGADLLALQKNRYWRTPQGFRVDVGGYVALLEFASGKQARSLGKPAPAFFRAALDRLGLPPERAAMVGDDVNSDVGAAQKLGLFGVLVRTGKFSETELRKSVVRPDLLLGSVAELA